MVATDGPKRSTRRNTSCRIRLSTALLLTMTSFALPAHADRASGAWSGTVEARGNYYWEKSTRVIAPTIALTTESPNGYRLQASYLVDAITSASQAAGAVVDVRFTEVRHDGEVGVGKELDLGVAQLDIDVRGRVSYEPDYLSIGGSVAAALALAERATTLRLAFSYLHDDIGRVLRGSGAMVDGRVLGDREDVGTLDAMVLSAGIGQVLAPTLLGEIGYDIAAVSGYQANPYRMISIPGAGALYETHPDDRLRHTLHGRLAWFIPRTGTAFHALYRAYVDSWDIAALTPEGRVYQEIGAFTQARVRYRYYAQTPSFFYQPTTEYTGQDHYITADPKMSRFHTQLLGLQLLLRFDFLEGSALNALRGAVMDLNFEYIWNTNRYGNGVISQLGLRIPF